MIIKKKLNNNVLLTIDNEGNEMVLIGNGLAFSSRPGELVDESKVEKIFRMTSQNESEKFADFLSSISKEQLVLIEKIMNYAETKLNIKLNQYLYLSLNDHLTSAIERLQQNIEITNPLLWEIKRIYPKEFEIGMYTLQLLNEQFEISFPEDEAGFIALHFVNAQQQKENMTQTMQIPKIVRDILNLIEYHFSREFSSETIAYERFLVHLKFFAHRVITKSDFPESNISITSQLAESWPKTYGCVLKIEKYMKETQDVQINEDEKFYLMVHIQHIIET